ncbi:MAG: GNAT family N-acetyltransferase [bacterium]
MNKFMIEEIIGKDLSKELIGFMVKHRIREYGENTKDFEANERESIFFFLKHAGEIKAFGMLKPAKIYHDSTEYDIMGVGNVMAIEKSKGYGSILMEYMRKYLEKNRFVCIGNTHKDNFEFYKKCGFTFIPDLVDRFVHIDKNGKHDNKKDWTDYGMFILDQDNKLEEIINGKKEIIIKIPLW